ncbi:Vps54-domain-containing protein, partial [Nadsonia fulvescens var. elongata DSM 6958]
GFKPPTLRDIPPVTLTKITKVKKAEFSKYLSDIGSVFDRYCYIKGLSADSFIKPMISDEETEKAINSNQYEPRRVSLSSSPSNSGLATPSSVSSAALAPLTTVPSVFFDDDFQLDNPRVFDVVSENASVVRHDAETPTRKVLANNAILQEKLSWYVDTVEIHLIDEISKASETFFSTLDELREIHADSEHTVERIQNLRNDLNALDQRQAVSGIKSLKLLQRKQNIDKLQQSLNQISLVMNLADNAETLYLESKLNACVDLIDTTESLIQGQNSFHLDSLSFPGLDLDKDIADWKAPLVDLRSVQGLSELRESLCVLRTNAGRKYSSNFVDILLNDIDLHLDSVSQQSTLKRMLQVLDKKSNRSQSTMMSENNTSCYSIVSDVFRKSLVENINGLFRSNLISDAFKSYRETVMKKARDIIKANLPSNGDDDNESISSSISLSSKFGGGRSAAERSMNLATRLRTLTSADFESFLIKVYTGLSELLRRLSIHQKLLLDTISSIPRILEEDPSLMMVINTRELIDEVIESTHDRIVRVINVRRDQISLCTLDQFLRFYVLNGIFLSECEAISGSVGMKLQSVINNQVRQFMAPYLKDQNKTIVTLLETDKWKDEEVPPELQQELDDIYASATNDPSSWTSALKNSLMSSLTDGESNNENVDDDKPSVKLSTKQRPRNVFVDTSSFIIPGGMIQIIPIIGEMLQLIVHFPYLSLEIINQVLEVLKCINITTNSLILKTGATKTAGLKHITAKHLALASQSLDLIITLIPYMREYCRPASSAGIKLLNQFNEIRSQLADHQQEIYTKFSTIMSDRLNGHINAIIKLDCSQLAKTSTTTATEIANTYMQVLCKETNTMAKVLVKFLPKAIYLDIIKRIFDNYETKLLASYQQLPITNATERAVIIRDVDYFIESLSPIEGTDSCGQVL